MSLSCVNSNINSIYRTLVSIRTETLYEDSVRVKLFIFQFVNSFVSMFYLAFVAKYVNDCPITGCNDSMSVLSYNLGWEYLRTTLLCGSMSKDNNFHSSLITYTIQELFWG